MGGMRIVFKGTRAKVTEALVTELEYECWMEGNRIVLYKSGSSTPSETIEINKDGTLQTDLAELKKKD